MSIEETDLRKLERAYCKVLKSRILESVQTYPNVRGIDGEIAKVTEGSGVRRAFDKIVETPDEEVNASLDHLLGGLCKGAQAARLRLRDHFEFLRSIRTHLTLATLLALLPHIDEVVLSVQVQGHEYRLGQKDQARGKFFPDVNRSDPAGL